MTPQEEIDQLRGIVRKHDDLYHNKDAPIISDQDYDQLVVKLRDLESRYPDQYSSDSPTVSANAKPSTGFATAKHVTRMMSLRTCTDATEKPATEFDTKIRAVTGYDQVVYCAEPKYDGLALDLRYENGMLTQALTRGDYETGEDVTANAKRIKDIPHQLRTAGDRVRVLHVRGEVYMRRSVFRRINDDLQTRGLAPLANTRNAAAGAMRQHDADVTESRSLSFYPYAVIPVDVDTEMIGTTQSEWYARLSEMGFTICPLIRAVYGGSLPLMHKLLMDKRAELDYDIDGVVYKVDDLQLQAHLGMGTKEPNWAIAHKFPAEEKMTRLHAIDVQVGRTGVLTPVGRVDPVHVGGVDVSNVSLKNFDEIQRLDVRVGDLVLVRRAGDVIPEVVRAIPADDDERAPARTVAPTHCPACGGPIHKELDQVAYRCTNHHGCPAQLVNSVLHFVQRDAMDVDGFGERLVQTLVDNGWIKQVVDIYCLGLREASRPLSTVIQTTSKLDIIGTASQKLSQLPGIGEKTIHNLIGSLEKSKTTTLAKFIYGLGIRTVGKTTANQLARHYGTIDRFIDARESDLLRIPDVGPTTARFVVEYLDNSQSLEQIQSFLNLGLAFETPSMQDLQGHTFVITGSFALGRYQIKTWLERRGAWVGSTVTPETTALICGRESGGKVARARQLGIPIVEEEQISECIRTGIIDFL